MGRQQTHGIIPALSTFLLTCLVLVSAEDYPSPTVIVTPQPADTDDSVTVRCVVGSDTTDCVFQYSNDFTVSLADGDTYPAEYRLSIDLTKSPPPRGMDCTDTVTEYGPTCSLGVRPLGHYNVLDHDGRVLGEFAVRPTCPALAVGGAINALWPPSSTAGTVAYLHSVSLDSSSADTLFSLVDTLLTDGSYFFAAPDSGNYRLTFVSDTFETLTCIMTLPAESADSTWGLVQDIVLVGKSIFGQVSGRVLDCMLRPLESCSVHLALTCPNPTGSDTVFLADQTGLDGGYHFDSLRAITPQGSCSYVVTASAPNCTSATVEGVLGSPTFAAQHELQVGCVACERPVDSRETVLNGIRYVATLTVEPEEFVCDDDTGTAIRFRARAYFDMYNEASTDVHLAADSLVACVTYRHVHAEEKCQITLYPAPIQLTYPWGMLWQSRPYFPDPLEQADSFRIPLPSIYADTLVGCTQLLLSDTVWASVALSGLAAGTTVDSLAIALDGQVLRAAVPQGGRGRAKTWGLLRVNSRQIMLTCAEPAIATIRLYTMQGRLVSDLAASEPLSAGTHLFYLPNCAGVFVLRISLGSDGHSKLLLLQ